MTISAIPAIGLQNPLSVNDYAAFMAAYNTPNANYLQQLAAYSQAAKSQSVNFQGQSSANTSSAVSNLPRRNYEEGSNGLLYAGGALAALTAAGTIACAIKGRKIGGIKAGFNAFVDSIRGKAAAVVKPTKAMKEFSFIAKDGSKIVVKDGKVASIIEKGTTETITDVKKIKELLKDKGINTSDITDWKTLLANGKKVKFKDYSFSFKYNGKNVKVENGVISEIEGIKLTSKEDILKNIGVGAKSGTEADIANIQKRIDLFNKDYNKFEKTYSITPEIASYEWSEGFLKGTMVKNKKGSFVAKEIVTGGTRKELTEVQRGAYLEQHADLNKQIESLIKDGRAENIRVGHSTCYDKNHNEIYYNSKGEIIRVRLNKPLEIDGKKVSVLTGGKDRTYLDNWLYNNNEAKEIVKKQFESGLANDGAIFVAS